MGFADKVKETQGAFPAEESRAVEACPHEQDEPEEEAPPEQPPAEQPPPPEQEQPRPQKTWIKIELVDMRGKPVPDEKYRITLPDGTVQEGTLDGKGQAAVYDIDPGTCKVTFPDLDKEAWEPV